jgi:hypothetical protein
MKSFTHGNVVITRTCQQYLNSIKQSPLPYLYRHLAGDWGDVDAHDRLANDSALETGARLFSSYNLGNGEKLWIITDAADDLGNRLATTVMLPADY